MPASTKKTFNLPQEKITRARKLLGTRTETETINVALDRLIADEELALFHTRHRGKYSFKKIFE